LLTPYLSLSNRSGHNAALSFIDLDNFKQQNDTFGHAAGDLILREAAIRLLATTRLADTVARIGGDEFVVLLETLIESPERALEEAQGVADKILSAIGQPYGFGRTSPPLHGQHRRVDPPRIHSGCRSGHASG
jgi:diguanylate cyclase (GGDEF)-like protein